MNWLNFQELNIVRDLTARLLSQPCYKTRKVNKEMFKLYLLDDRQTYRFRAGVHCVSSKAVTLGNLEIFYNDKFAFCIRGWGKLTGTGGGLNLSTDEAMKIQDEFAKWVLQTLQLPAIRHKTSYQTT